MSDVRQIARAAGTVMAAFILSNLVGLVRQILAARAFGTEASMEAFNAANRVAETLFNLVAGGALSSAFIPTFTAIITRGDRSRAWKLASNVGNLIIAILTGLSILALIFAPAIVRHVLAPGFSDQPQKFELTVQLMRLMLPSAVVFGLSGLLMGVLNSNRIFFLPAIAPAMYQLGLIFGILVLAPQMGIHGLAWGVLIGAGLHLAVQTPGLLRLGGSYYRGLGLSSEDVREVIRLMGPRLLGVAVVQLNFWINTRLASHFVEGSVTAIVLAFSLMLMPQAAIAQSIAIAAMPTFSAQVSLGRLNAMRTALAASLRAALVLAIPASVGLILLRRPIVTLLYQRGEFGEFSTTLVAWALLWYSAGLIGHALVEILSRAFYALHDTRTPVLIGIAAMVLNILFSYLFSALFGRIGWLEHGGLALANTTATTIEACLLWVFMRGRLQGMESGHIIAGAAQAAFAASLMSLGVWTWAQSTASEPAWITSSGGVIIGAAVFIAAALALRMNEALVVVRAIKRRLEK